MSQAKPKAQRTKKTKDAVMDENEITIIDQALGKSGLKRAEINKVKAKLSGRTREAAIDEIVQWLKERPKKK